MKITFIIAVCLALTSRAWAYVYWTPTDLLANYFPGGAPEAVRFEPSSDQQAALRAALGYPLPERAYTIHVGRGADGTAAYAILDHQLGQHEPIDFGVRFDAAGTVDRVEILVYREAYGEGIRADAFRRQFVGLGPTARMRPGKEIQIVSGATVSTRSLSTGVRRVCLVLASWLGRPLARNRGPRLRRPGLGRRRRRWHGEHT